MHKKRFSSFTVVFVLVFVLAGSVEASSPTWSQTYGGIRGDWATSVIATSDGGYAIAGSTDFCLVKTDGLGNMEWSQTYEAPNGGWAYSLIETSDGGYALVGALDLFGDDCLADFWLIKTDADGNMEWNQTYLGGGTQDGRGALFLSDRSLVETSDGGYAIAGYTNSSGAGGDDFLLIKTDASGNMEWNRTYGGTENDHAYSLVQTSDGGYALGGEKNADATVSGFGDFWLVKTDADGNMEWNRTYIRTPHENWFLIPAFSLVITSDGGYALAAASGDFGTADVYLIKTDSFGTMEWSQTYGGPDIDWATSLVATSDGGYAIVGNTQCSGAGAMDFWLIKTDANGNMEWKQTCGGTEDDRAFSLAEAHDGGYVLAGYTHSFSDARDFWLVKTDGCTPASDLVAYEFDFTYGYDMYVVVMETNSTIGDFDFGIGQNQISFSVTGPNGTTGFSRIIIPEKLVDGEFPVYLGDVLLVEGVDYFRMYNGTHTTFEITYSHSTHIIEITGTNVVPEYSSWILPSLLLVAASVTVIYRKRLINQKS